jgi:hypothetical protein
MADVSGSGKGTPPTGFAPAKKYIREGTYNHPSGWQEEPPQVVAGHPVPPRAPKGSIARTPLAERFNQDVAKNEKG